MTLSTSRTFVPLSFRPMSGETGQLDGDGLVYLISLGFHLCLTKAELTKKLDSKFSTKPWETGAFAPSACGKAGCEVVAPLLLMVYPDAQESC